MNLFAKQEQTHRVRKQTYLPKGKSGEGKIQFEINIYMLLYVKQITQDYYTAQRSLFNILQYSKWEEIQDGGAVGGHGYISNTLSKTEDLA